MDQGFAAGAARNGACLGRDKRGTGRLAPRTPHPLSSRSRHPASGPALMFTKDLGFAVRSLRKHPAFTLTAIVTIALGVGATTAIFSVVNAVLLRPLPYAQPDRLALIKSDMK